MKKTSALVLTAVLLGVCLSLPAQAIKPPVIKNAQFISAEEVKLSAKEKIWTVKYRPKCPKCGEFNKAESSGVYAPRHRSRQPGFGEYPTDCDKCGHEFKVIIVQQ